MNKPYYNKLCNELLKKNMSELKKIAKNMGVFLPNKKEDICKNLSKLLSLPIISEDEKSNFLNSDYFDECNKCYSKKYFQYLCVQLDKLNVKELNNISKNLGIKSSTSNTKKNLCKVLANTILFYKKVGRFEILEYSEEDN